MVGKTGGEEESQLLVKSQASCLFYNWLKPDLGEKNP